MRSEPQKIIDLLKLDVTFEVPMVWIETTAGDAIGIWSGASTEYIIANDQWTGRDKRRLFYAGGVLEVGPYRAVAGLNIHPVTLRLSAIDAAVLTAFRQYDARGAKVQAWRRIYNPDTGKPVAARHWFKGWINAAPSERPVPGGEAAIDVEVVSVARTLTITSNLKKSDAAQRQRQGDRIRRYKGSTRTWSIPWGTEDAKLDRGKGKDK